MKVWWKSSGVHWTLTRQASPVIFVLSGDLDQTFTGLLLEFYEVFTLPHGSYRTPIRVWWDYWSLLGVYWESNGTGSPANLLPNGESNPSPIPLESNWTPSRLPVQSWSPLELPVDPQWTTLTLLLLTKIKIMLQARVEPSASNDYITKLHKWYKPLSHKAISVGWSGTQQIKFRVKPIKALFTYVSLITLFYIFIMFHIQTQCHIYSSTLL